ncbi:MAG: hypothetical protein IJY66_08420, partial [Clostridia bacterium]|nr:hypothetical protein [Clostridia bacterium]
FLLKRTRLSQTADFAFAASKRTAKTKILLREEKMNSIGRRKRREFLREEMLSGCAAFFPLRHPERSAAQRAESNGSRNGFFL